MNEQVLAMGERLHGADSPKLLGVLANLAQNAYLLGQPQLAPSWLQRRLALALQHERAAEVDDSLFQLGVLVFEQDRIDQARTLMQRRLALAEASGDAGSIAAARAALDELERRRQAG